jgi:hypothetical protein
MSEKIELVRASSTGRRTPRPWCWSAASAQGIVDGRQQRGDAQATDHAEQDRHADDQSKGLSRANNSLITPRVGLLMEVPA